MAGEPKPKEAYFISPDAMGLTIWIKPITETRYPDGRTVTDQGSGQKAKFENGCFKTSDPKVIKFLKEHSMFEIDFYPDPRDPTGYWRADGYFKEESKKIITRAKQESEVQKQAEKSMAGIVTSIRTSDSPPKVKEK